MRPLHGLAALASFAAVMAAGPACARNPDPLAFGGALAAGAPIQVDVANHGWADAAVYVLSGGISQRIGFVNGFSEQTFNIPAAYLSDSGDFQLQAHPIGSPGGLTTDRLTIHSGQFIRFTIENQLANSSAGVY
ncbi:MAG TPA: hypothetical protein VFW66_03925 [Gemmatimonadales bacterium]|nr:hypothetical protein [Gemmatimonadales bacterium]